MNVTFFDPYYVKPEMLLEIVHALKINEVYSFIPEGYINADINVLLDDKLTFKRNPVESFDDAIRRGVHKLVSLISHPLVVYGEWIGDCVVEDVFCGSSSERYVSNLCLDDPNFLFLWPNKDITDEPNNVRFFSYFFNILKKYGKIDYSKRICRVVLSRYITCETNEWSFKYRISYLSEAPTKTLMDYFHEANPNTLAQLLLTDAGYKKRKVIIEEDENMRRQFSCENDNNDWGQASEMGYMVNNGGDWIYY